MKAMGDFLAVLLFVGMYAVTQNMVLATATAVVIGVGQAAYTWWKHQKLSMMQWVSLIAIVVFGGATIILKDFVYIAMKTTVVCWLTALVIGVLQWRGKNGLKMILAQDVVLPEKVWTNLSYAWVVFFVSLGLVNVAIAYPFTPDREAFWVSYKLYGYLPLIFVFSLAQGVYIFRHLPKEEKQ